VYVEIIIDPQAVVRNNTEIPCNVYPVSPNGGTTEALFNIQSEYQE
jgi:hypothetical protein